jgi:hypothetical protein
MVSARLLKVLERQRELPKVLEQEQEPVLEQEQPGLLPALQLEQGLVPAPLRWVQQLLLLQLLLLRHRPVVLVVVQRPQRTIKNWSRHYFG